MHRSKTEEDSRTPASSCCGRIGTPLLEEGEEEEEEEERRLIPAEVASAATHRTQPGWQPQEAAAQSPTNRVLAAPRAAEESRLAVWVPWAEAGAAALPPVLRRERERERRRRQRSKRDEIGP